MNEPTFRRRRRRRQSDSSQIDVPLIKPTETEIETSSAEPTETNDNTSLNIPQVTVDHETSHQATIDRIRSEINEDEYYSRLDKPDYSDGSHDWGDDEESVSSNYWHFLGRFE